MVLEKTTTNTTRGIVKDLIDYLYSSRTKIEENISLLQKDEYKRRYAKDRFSLIDRVNAACNTNFSYHYSLEDIVCTLKEYVIFYTRHIEKAKSLLSALSKNGFTKKTFGLEAFPFNCHDKSIAVPFLMVSGIKVNSALKDIKELDDHRELNLYTLEKSMARYIKEDFSIEFADMIPFLELYKKYLESCLELDDIFEKEVVITYKDLFLLTMGLFITYSSTGTLAEDYDIVNLYGLFEDYVLSGVVSTVEAIELTCSWFVYEVDKIEKNRKPSQYVVEADPIMEFVKDNRVIKVCELERFEELLRQSSLDETTRDILMNEMLYAIEQNRIEKHKSELEILKNTVFNAQERELYNLGRCYKECEKTMTDIDALLELMLENDDESIRDSLAEELASEMDTLRRWMPLELDEPSVSIVYYNSVVEDIKGSEVSIPAMLVSILKDKMICGVYVDDLLKEILDGKTIGDKKIKIPNLPCTVWMKGREWKILYTKIRDTFVVIDVASSLDVYDAAGRLTGDAKFKEFLATVEAYVSSGNVPSSAKYTDIIRTSLNRPSKMMKLI